MNNKYSMFNGISMQVKFKVLALVIAAYSSQLLAESASARTGFKVIVSNLRCSIDGVMFRSFDYEWYPTPEFSERPSLLARTLAELYDGLRN